MFNNHCSHPFFFGHTHIHTQGLGKEAWVRIEPIPLNNTSPFHVSYKGDFLPSLEHSRCWQKKNTIDVLFLFSITQLHGIILVGFVWPRYNSAKCIVAVFEFTVQYLSLWSLDFEFNSCYKYLSMCFEEFIAIFNLIS